VRNIDVKMGPKWARNAHAAIWAHIGPNLCIPTQQHKVNIVHINVKMASTSQGNLRHIRKSGTLFHFPVFYLARPEFWLRATPHFLNNFLPIHLILKILFTPVSPGSLVVLSFVCVCIFFVCVLYVFSVVFAAVFKQEIIPTPKNKLYKIMFCLKDSRMQDFNLL